MHPYTENFKINSNRVLTHTNFDILWVEKLPLLITKNRFVIFTKAVRHIIFIQTKGDRESFCRRQSNPGPDLCAASRGRGTARPRPVPLSLSLPNSKEGLGPGRERARRGDGACGRAALGRLARAWQVASLRGASGVSPVPARGRHRQRRPGPTPPRPGRTGGALLDLAAGRGNWTGRQDPADPDGPTQVGTGRRRGEACQGAPLSTAPQDLHRRSSSGTGRKSHPPAWCRLDTCTGDSAPSHDSASPERVYTVGIQRNLSEKTEE